MRLSRLYSWFALCSVSVFPHTSPLFRAGRMTISRRSASRGLFDKLSLLEVASGTLRKRNEQNYSIMRSFLICQFWVPTQTIAHGNILDPSSHGCLPASFAIPPKLQHGQWFRRFLWCRVG